MKKALKYIIPALLGLGILTAILFSYRSGVTVRAGVLCKAVRIVVSDSTKNSFVKAKDIRSILDREYGQYLGKSLDSLDLNRIEQLVNSRSAVLESNAYTTNDGVLHISLTQRRPAVRFQRGNEGFYADKAGVLFPLQNGYTSHVPVVDGDIPLKVSQGFKGRPEDEEERAWIDSILNLLDFLSSDNKWEEFFVQINVNGNGDLVLIPRKGTEKFNIGKADNLEEKFERIKLYYSNIAPNKEEGYYRMVNVKFEGQIICKK